MWLTLKVKQYPMNKQLLTAALLVFHLSSCQKEAEPGVAPETAATKTNVPYGTDPKQKMDIYLPAGRTTDTTKSIILIHGGAWSEGDKLDFTPHVSQLQQRLPGYAVFNVNYRLAVNGTNLFPAQENDIKAALEFIDSKKAEYKISDKFVLLGASAGGHLALLQGYKYSTPIKPKAVVSFFGPSDLTALYNSGFLAALGLSGVTGTDPVANPALYQQSSPLTYVTAQSPPTILLQGGADPLVPVAQAEALKTKLTTSGVTNQYVFYPTQTHGWFGDTLNHSFDKITEFLKTNVP
jgi:acetyl esterase/lipase